jgi:hypothetical protein
MDVIKSLFYNFMDYMILVDIKIDDVEMRILYEYIDYDDVDPDIDIDEECYYRIINTVEKHFEIYSKEFLQDCKMKRVIFDSSTKKIKFEYIDNLFSTTMTNKK